MERSKIQLPLLGFDDICANNHGGNAESVAAHKSIVSLMPDVRKKVFEFILTRGKNGATCDEIEVALGISHQSASARCTELKATGNIRTLGTRKTRGGRNAAVLVNATTTTNFWEAD